MTIDRVIEAVRATAGCETITVTHATEFDTLDFDSLDMMDLVDRLDPPHAIPDAVERMAVKAKTVGELWEAFQ